MIGIFDSGIGGIVLLKALKKRMPKESFVYLADRANFPYGEKNVSAINNLVKKNIEFLMAQKSEQIVIACNTASVTLKSKHSYPIPVKGVIEASLKQASRSSVNKKIGLLATRVTVKSKIFLKRAKKLNLNLQIYQQACPLLAPCIEQGAWMLDKEYTKANQTYKNQIKIQNKKILPLLQKYLDPLMKKGVDTVILGCTHYLYVKSAIQEYMGENKKAIGPINFLVKKLWERKKLAETKKKYYSDHSRHSGEVRNPKKEPTTNIFINGKNIKFAEQCHQIWGDENNIKISYTCI